MKNYRFSTTNILGFLGVLALLGACKDPKTFTPNSNESFVNHDRDYYRQASALLQADYLFVMDYSAGPAIQTKRENLYDSFSDFTETLLDSDIDYRIGFVDGGIQATNPDRFAAVNSDFIVDNFFTSSMSSSLTQNLVNEVERVGEALQPNWFVPMESAEKVLKNQGSSFLRDSAQLVYVFISDEDDQAHTRLNSNRTENYYIERLKKFKSHPSYISSRAIVAGTDAQCPLQNTQFSAAGTRIANISKELDSVKSESVCIYDNFASTLEDLARNITRPTTRFALKATPVQDTIRVTENGKNVPASGNWYYENNEIIFLKGKEPDFDASLEITYDVLFALKGSPNPNSIEVEVNGKTVPRSNSNGWSYVAGENRIAFHGNSLPSGANVLVRYLED